MQDTKEDVQAAFDELEALGLIMKIGDRYYTPDNAPRVPLGKGSYSGHVRRLDARQCLKIQRKNSTRGRIY